MLQYLVPASIVAVLVYKHYTQKPVNMTAKHVDTIKGLIKANSVLVASKSWCPFCSQTKRLLADAGATPKVVELDQMDEGAELQQAFKSVTGLRTVPQTFIGGRFVGDNSQLQDMGVSKLKELLAQNDTQAKL